MKEHKPWGEYEVVAQGPTFKVKIIHINPGQRTSLQRHIARSEHWFVVSGTACAQYDTRHMRTERVLYPGDYLDVGVAVVHRIGSSERDTGTRGLTFVEVQFGTELSENDITRLEDDYGRA